VCGCGGAKPKVEPVNSQAATKAWRRLNIMVTREERNKSYSKPQRQECDFWRTPQSFVHIHLMMGR
jgi:hypothetical protein